MKRAVRYIFVILVFYTLNAYSQKKSTQSCESSCFNTEVVNTQKLSETCTQYEWKVSYSGKCDHALSHFTASIPCGQLKNVSNSENWKQVFGTDPTTGLTGFKIDDITEFGTTSLKSFTVKFTVCTDNNNCAARLACWKPVLAYKFSTCIDYDTLQIPCSNLKASLQSKNLSCYEEATGSLSVTIEEGTEPYTFLWSNGATTQNISSLAAGDYSVLIKDASGAELSLEKSIIQPDKINVSSSVQQASCNSSSDGAVDVTVTGGVAPYHFLWSNGMTSEDINGLKSGTYTLRVTDAANCSTTQTVEIRNESAITIAVSQTMPDCSQTNGSLNITVSGGLEPYTYLWSNGATTEDIQNLSAGFYKVTVTASNGCALSITYNLKENNTLKLSANVTQTSCLDDSSGSIDLTVTGGMAPYTYTWTNGATVEDLAGLTSGTYTVTVTDSKGCSTTLRVFVAKKMFLVPNVVTQPACNGDDTGSITLLTPTGGEAPYTYQWSTGATGSSITGLQPGTYSVIVTDNTGCSRQLFFVITKPSTISASSVVSNEHCNANGFFEIDLSVSGGTAPYTFVWSNGAVTEDIDSLQAGNYKVQVTDANGCTISKSVIIESAANTWSCLINQPDSIPLCGSVSNMLTTSITGATYSWTVQSSDSQWKITDGASSAGIQYSAGGVNSSATFTLSVTKDGCTQTCTFRVEACKQQSNEEENPGSEDPGSEDPGGEEPGEDPDGEVPGGEDNPGDGTCEECFDSGIKILNEQGSCRTYEVTVSTDGNCRHELSHWVIAIPCGTVKEYSNSEGWKMEFGKDPTSGVYGLKVDEISGFGKEADHFTVRFTVCTDNSCGTWSPVVAYKASTCVGYDTLNISTSVNAFNIAWFPNPFKEQLSITWTADQNDHVEIDLLNHYGTRIDTIYDADVQKGETYSYALNTSALPDGIYYYRFVSGSKTIAGKLVKK